MDCPIAHLELSADFSDMKDIVVFRYWSHGEWKRLGAYINCISSWTILQGAELDCFVMPQSKQGNCSVS